MSTYKIITRRATVYDAQGYIEGRAVEITDFGDTLAIGRSEMPKDELEIDLAAGEIRPKNGSWSVTWEPKAEAVAAE